MAAETARRKRLDWNHRVLNAGTDGSGRWLNQRNSASSEDPALARRPGRFPAESLEGLRLELVYKVQLSTAESKQFDVAIRLYVETEGIDVREALPVGADFPVVRVSLQQNVLPALVLRQDKGAQNCASRRSLPCRRNGELIEEKLETGHLSGEGKRHAARAVRLRGQLTGGRPEGVRDRGLQPGRHQAANRRDDIGGSEWRAIGEAHVRPQLEIDPLSVARDLPCGGQLGLQPLGLTIETDQHTARQITDGFGNLFLGQERVQGLRVGPHGETKARFPPGNMRSPQSPEESRFGWLFPCVPPGNHEM